MRRITPPPRNFQVRFHYPRHLTDLDLDDKFRKNYFNKGLGFMTATRREGQWLNSVGNPYTKQYDILEPTPKSLYHDKKKKVDRIRNKILKKRKKKVENPPFNVLENRSFEYLGKTLGPGPGSYINVNDPKFSSVMHKHTHYGNTSYEDAKPSPGKNNFGSSIERFDNPHYKKEMETPGPGAYQKPVTVEE